MSENHKKMPLIILSTVQTVQILSLQSVTLEKLEEANGTFA